MRVIKQIGKSVNRLLLVAVIAVNASGYAQNTFFATKEGTVLVYVQKNDKGKEDSYVRQTIKKVESSGNKLSIN